MGGAISLSANNDTGGRIVRLWNAVSAFEDEPSMARLRYPPHFTFAYYDDVGIGQIRRTVRTVFAGHPPICITFDRVGFFDVSPLVLWAAPRNATQLAAFHTAIHGHIDPARCHEHYRPKSWVPHCTLGTRIQDKYRSQALAFAAEVNAPFEVIFDAADCISFPPVEVVESQQLVATGVPG